jgi:6-phosphogluconolactonase
MNKLIYFFPVLIYACTAAKKTDLSQQPILFVGTYTQKLGHVDGRATGIYTCRFNTETGIVTVVDSATDVVNPSFVTVSPDKKYLYSVGEVSGSGTQRLGKVLSYKIRDGGKLLKINEMPSYGNAPCHISTDNTGRFVFAANYLTGNVLSYGVKADGGLTDTVCMDQHAGKSPWAHQIRPMPDGKHVIAVDKGADKVFIYALGQNGILAYKNSVTTAKGAGPRHMDIMPKNANRIAVINENSSALGIYDIDPKTMNIKLLDSTSTLPKDFTGSNTCADVHFHPNGKFVYGSNRGHNSIVTYAIDEQTGKLTVVGHTPTQGLVPRNFMITPDGAWLLVANQNSSNVVSFKIDTKTGMLANKGIVNVVMTPVCLILMDN